MLVDSIGRKVRYLRLSITDRCNLRCSYCMPEDTQFIDRATTLAVHEFVRIAHCFVALGVEKIRISGGEPLIHPQIIAICQNIAAIDGVTQLVMTTNGLLLPKYSQQLAQIGVHAVNISLDTISPSLFRSITRIGNVAQVIAGIDAAKRAGLTVKINAVLLPQIAMHHYLELVQFAFDKQCSIRFIEEMPLGQMQRNQTLQQLSLADTLLTQLEQRFTLKPIAKTATAGPAQLYYNRTHDCHIGFIRALTQNFCSDCNRVRVSCNGQLYPCLGDNNHLDLRQLLRANSSDEQLQAAIVQAIGSKAQQHQFNAPQTRVLRFMNVTGG